MARCKLPYDQTWLQELCAELVTAGKFLSKIMMVETMYKEEERGAIYKELEKTIPTLEKEKEVEEYMEATLRRLSNGEVVFDDFYIDELQELMDELLAAQDKFTKAVQEEAGEDIYRT